MPVNRHLVWNEIRDFRPGLWTKGDTWLMPPTAAQEMQDCYPVEGLGLRAFYRRQATANTGLTPAQELYFGIFAHPSGGINPTSERYLMSWDSVTRVPKLWYSADGVTWTTIKSFVATSATPTIKQSFFTTYLSGTTRKVAFNLNASSTDDGIWIVTGGGVPTKMTVTGGTAPSGPITVHQARLVITDGASIRFTDINTETFQATNVITTEPSGLRPNTVVMVSYEPSDLLLGKEAGPFVLIQGDLTDPTVRALDDTIALVASHRPAKTPQGLAVTAHRDGEFFTSPGGGSTKASDSLSHNNFSLPAQFGAWTPSWIGDSYYSEGFLYTPAAVLDMRSGSWFTILNPPGNFMAAMFAYDRGTIS